MAPLVAVADPPLDVIAGPGVRMRASVDEGDQDVTDHSSGALAALDATLALRVSNHVAIGIHASVSQPLHYVDRYPFGNGPTAEYQMWPYDLGLVVPVSFGHAWVAPWVGVAVLDQYVSGSGSFGSPEAPLSPWTKHAVDVNVGFGLTAGYDLISHGVDHLALFVAVQRQMISFEVSGALPLDYAVVTCGIAYRRSSR